MKKERQRANSEALGLKSIDFCITISEIKVPKGNGAFAEWEVEKKG